MTTATVPSGVTMAAPETGEVTVEGTAVVTEARTRLTCALALFAALAPATVSAQRTPSPTCQPQVFRGRVIAGESHEIALSPSLVFRLEPDTVAANPPGWTIRVTSPRAPGDDYSMVATPPYRFANPRYVDTG